MARRSFIINNNNNKKYYYYFSCKIIIIIILLLPFILLLFLLLLHMHEQLACTAIKRQIKMCVGKTLEEVSNLPKLRTCYTWEKHDHANQGTSIRR